MEKTIQIVENRYPTRYLENIYCGGNVYALAENDCPAACPQRRHKIIERRSADSTPVRQNVYICAAFSQEADLKNRHDLREARLQTMYAYVVDRIRNGYNTPLPRCCGYRAIMP